VKQRKKNKVIEDIMKKFIVMEISSFYPGQDLIGLNEPIEEKKRIQRS
jgi:hypothetical protein